MRMLFSSSNIYNKFLFCLFFLTKTVLNRNKNLFLDSFFVLFLLVLIFIHTHTHRQCLLSSFFANMCFVCLGSHSFVLQYIHKQMIFYLFSVLRFLFCFFLSKYHPFTFTHLTQKHAHTHIFDSFSFLFGGAGGSRGRTKVSSLL